MKSTLIYKTKVIVTVRGNRRISVVMDLYKLPPTQRGYPEGYKFSWIAFDPRNPMERVLFDVHLPKGPHIHIDEDPEGTPYTWSGIKEAEAYFIIKIEERFGKILEEDE